MASAIGPNGDVGQCPTTSRVPLVVPTPAISPMKRSPAPIAPSEPRTVGIVGWEQLHAGVVLPIEPSITVPRLTRVELPVPDPPACRRRRGCGARGGRAGPRPCGRARDDGGGRRRQSRPDGRVELLRGAIAGLRDLGAAPFVVPAMGSHGGATAEGQLATLASSG